MYSHTAIILLLILLQIGIMVLTFTYLGNYSTYMNGVMSLLSFITAIYIFNEKGNPAFKMTWILFVFLVPVVGVGFYLFTKAGIGTKYLGARLEKLRVETEPYMQQNMSSMRLKVEGLRMPICHIFFITRWDFRLMGTHRHSIFHWEMTNFRF